MILEEETFKKFGYYPRDLKPKSHKTLLAKCDECGNIRELKKANYYDLCYKCAMKHVIPPLLEKHHPMETKEKISNALKGNTNCLGHHHSKETIEKMSESHKGKQTKPFSGKHKKKMSEAAIKRYKNPENNPNWKGGISFEPYCEKFDDEFKERVREYWNRKCVLCDKDENVNKRKLNVHHVTYNKDTCCDNSIPLFITLCNSCHSKVHNNREYWKEYFENIISKQNKNGKCFYTKEEMYER